jgi:hypothetical protein
MNEKSFIHSVIYNHPKRKSLRQHCKENRILKQLIKYGRTI